MKLFVDDIRNAPDESWTVARTVGAAIRAIARFDFEEISLDHDISHQIHMDSLSRPFPCSETFQPVAHFIGMKYTIPVGYGDGSESRLPKMGKIPVVTLHTSNPVGGEEMFKILESYGLHAEKKYMGGANRLEMETR